MFDERVIDFCSSKSQYPLSSSCIRARVLKKWRKYTSDTIEQTHTSNLTHVAALVIPHCINNDGCILYDS